MRVGILGSGLMGGKLGTLFARTGHEVVFSYSRSEKKLERLAREAGGKARAGTPAEATRNAEAVLIAVHWSRIDDVLSQAGDLSDKVLLSCSLPMNADDTGLVVARGGAGEEGSRSARRFRHQHGAERGALRRFRIEGQCDPSQPRPLRRRRAREESGH